MPKTQQAGRDRQSCSSRATKVTSASSTTTRSRFETYTADADLSELFKGLPDDRCQCPHWGVVLKGKLKYTTDDGDTIIGAGEAYYVPAGHLPYLYAGTEVIEFSPTKQLQETLAVLEKNMAEAG